MPQGILHVHSPGWKWGVDIELPRSWAPIGSRVTSTFRICHEDKDLCVLMDSPSSLGLQEGFQIFKGLSKLRCQFHPSLEMKLWVPLGNEGYCPLPC